ncbi:WhiB family transcriptional regulator [Streptosporangium amethystogenes subsp. fukuiense]|uniref:WhiB family transcriptional regulator n=1 Tax=Streptosporangium amethystogenes subsp. fukuiense TaxID=698418 RepID=A0ABW2T6K4_9ACTN
MIVDWGQAGPCREGDPDDWFVDNQTNEWAWELCRGCPILRPCGEYALLLDVQGVWGGLTVRRRRAIQRRRGITPTPVGETISISRPAPRSLALWAASEQLLQDGVRLPEVAEQLGVKLGLLKAARKRARRHLAEVTP